MSILPVSPLTKCQSASIIIFTIFFKINFNVLYEKMKLPNQGSFSVFVISKAWNLFFLVAVF